MSALTATALYGSDPTAVQPTGSPTVDHQGAPEPQTATAPAAGKAESPIVALMVILGVALVLSQVALRR